MNFSLYFFSEFPLDTIKVKLQQTETGIVKFNTELIVQFSISCNH